MKQAVMVLFMTLYLAGCGGVINVNNNGIKNRCYYTYSAGEMSTVCVPANKKPPRWLQASAAVGWLA